MHPLKITVHVYINRIQTRHRLLSERLQNSINLIDLWEGEVETEGCLCAGQSPPSLSPIAAAWPSPRSCRCMALPPCAPRAGSGRRGLSHKHSQLLLLALWPWTRDFPLSKQPLINGGEITITSRKLIKLPRKYECK